jgi:hypothetical protein
VALDPDLNLGLDPDTDRSQVSEARLYDLGMKMLTFVGIVLGLVIVTVSWIGQNVNDSGFRQDIAFIPALVDNRNGATASAIAAAVKLRAADHGIELGPDALRVDVSESKQGRYHVVGGALEIKGPAAQLMAVQDVSIKASYDRKFLGMFTRHISTTVDTTAPGAGPASTYPAPAASPVAVPP